jgi:hypothetical protein
MAFNLELQKGIYSALSGNVIFNGQPVPVYDSPPKNQSYPYIVIGDDILTPFDTDTSVGAEVIAPVYIWDNYRGYKRIKSIADDVYSLLNRQAVTVTGYNVLDCMFDSGDYFLDSDGKTRRGVISFKLLLDEV